MPDSDRGSKGERPRREDRGARDRGSAAGRPRENQGQSPGGPRQHGRGGKPGGSAERNSGQSSGQRSDASRKPSGGQRGDAVRKPGGGPRGNGSGKPAGSRGDSSAKPSGGQRGGGPRGNGPGKPAGSRGDSPRKPGGGVRRDGGAAGTERGRDHGPNRGGNKGGHAGPGDRRRSQDGGSRPQRSEKPTVANRQREREQGRVPEPALPDGAKANALDAEARKDLLGLPKALAEQLGRHLVAAGTLVDSDPAKALQHARYARSRAGRIAIVREAAGIAAYHAGEWNEALAELRAYRRMRRANAHLAVLADCERALGRPQRALDLAKEARGAQLDKAEAVELRIVAAGARRDLGQLEAAVVHLQGKDLDANRRDPWSPRLFYAYADNLLAAGRTEEAVRWFLHAAEADPDGMTDAAERAVEVSEALRAPEHDESLESHRTRDDHP